MDYAIQLQQRTQELEIRADKLKQLQDTNTKQREKITTRFHLELAGVDEELQLFEKDLRRLAQVTKTFITAFQHVGMKGQLDVLKDRADAIPFHEWITKKEFEKKISK